MKLWSREVTLWFLAETNHFKKKQKRSFTFRVNIIETTSRTTSISSSMAMYDHYLYLISENLWHHFQYLIGPQSEFFCMFVHCSHFPQPASASSVLELSGPVSNGWFLVPTITGSKSKTKWNHQQTGQSEAKPLSCDKLGPQPKTMAPATSHAAGTSQEQATNAGFWQFDSLIPSSLHKRGTI